MPDALEPEIAMFRLGAPLVAALVLACGGFPGGGVGQRDPADGTQGWTQGGMAGPQGASALAEVPGFKRTAVMDDGGFGQRMEAYSLLLPDGWTMQSQIALRRDTKCPPEVVHNRVTATSADRAWVFDMYPVEESHWYDDRAIGTQMQAAGIGCRIAQPMDLPTFVQSSLAQQIGAQVVAVDLHQPMLQMRQQQADAENQQYRSAKSRAERKVDAAIATLRYPDGTAGFAIAGMSQLTNPLPQKTAPNNKGVMTKFDSKVSLKFPAGQEQQARTVLDTIVGSIQMSPNYIEGVNQVVASMFRQQPAQGGSKNGAPAGGPPGPVGGYNAPPGGAYGGAPGGGAYGGPSGAYTNDDTGIPGRANAMQQQPGMYGNPGMQQQPGVYGNPGATYAPPGMYGGGPSYGAPSMPSYDYTGGGQTGSWQGGQASGDYQHDQNIRAIQGVDGYIGVDGTVVDVPIGGTGPAYQYGEGGAVIQPSDPYADPTTSGYTEIKPVEAPE